MVYVSTIKILVNHSKHTNKQFKTLKLKITVHPKSYLGPFNSNLLFKVVENVIRYLHTQFDVKRTSKNVTCVK